MPSTAHQLRQRPTVEAIERGPYFADVVIGVYILVVAKRLEGKLAGALTRV